MQQVCGTETRKLFWGNGPVNRRTRNADVVALTEVETLEITKTILTGLLANNAALAQSLSQMIAERQSGLDEYAALCRARRNRFRVMRFFGESSGSLASTTCGTADFLPQDLVYLDRLLLALTLI